MDIINYKDTSIRLLVSFIMLTNTNEHLLNTSTHFLDRFLSPYNSSISRKLGLNMSSEIHLTYTGR